MSQTNLITLLSIDECRAIVAKYNQENSIDLKLKSYEIIPATEAKGFLGEYFHLIISCYQIASEELKLSEEHAVSDAIVLKFFLKNISPVAEEHEKITVFAKESAFYGSLLAELQKYSPTPWSPKVYLCDKNPLVLEDLEALGYRSLTSSDFLTELEMYPILKGLASMHASSLLYEKLQQNNIETSFCECLKEITVHPNVAWFSTGLKAILELAKHHPKYQAEVSQKFIRDELPLHIRNLYFMVNPSPKYQNVLCHRDTWGGNIFLDPNNIQKSAIFVDFQTCRYCPPAIDVIFTLFMNLTKDERLAKQAKYIKFYYEQLQSYICKCIPANISVDDVIFSEAEFIESIEEFQLFGLIYRVLAASILKVPKEMVTEYYKNVERSEKLLAYMQENKEFRQLMEESIEDIIEAVVDMSIKSNMY